MFLAFFLRSGVVSPVALQRAIDDFALDGRRVYQKVERGPLTVVTTSKRPNPPTADEPGGRRFVVASGDAYDLPAAEPGTSPLAATLLAAYTAHGRALTPPKSGCFAFLCHDRETG